MGVYTADGMSFGDNTARIKHHAKFNVGKRFLLTDLEPESKKARGFFEGAVIPMWIYLDGYDHRDSTKHEQYREIAREEFCPEMLIVAGKQKLKGGSTKGKLNGENGIINKVIDFLEEQYGIKRQEVLLQEDYKKWRDTILPFYGADNYIDYLVQTKRLWRDSAKMQKYVL